MFAIKWYSFIAKSSIFHCVKMLSIMTAAECWWPIWNRTIDRSMIFYFKRNLFWDSSIIQVCDGGVSLGVVEQNFFVTSIEWISPTIAPDKMKNPSFTCFPWSIYEFSLLIIFYICFVKYVIKSFLMERHWWHDLLVYGHAGSHPVTRFQYYDPWSPKSTNWSRYLHQSSLVSLVRVF